jgi:uncharacterized membrane protein
LTRGSSPSFEPALIAYVLMAAGFVFPPAAAAGAVYAMHKRGESALLDSHLVFLTRTFWVGAGILLLGLLLLPVLAGIIVVGVGAVWTALRLISGYLAANAGNPLDAPGSLGMIAR